MGISGRFAQQPETVFQTGDGDEYRFCETAINVRPAEDVWDGHYLQARRRVACTLRTQIL
jgi:hypothetical protein